MKGNELFKLDTYLYSILSADTTLTNLLGGLKIYGEAAPQNTPGPFVIVAFHANTDTQVSAAVRIATRPLVCIKAVTQENTLSAADTIASRIDALIVETRGIVSGLNIACCGRESMLRTWEVDQGLRWNYVGGLYRFFIS